MTRAPTTGETTITPQDKTSLNQILQKQARILNKNIHTTQNQRTKTKARFSRLETEWDYSGRMERDGKARK